MKESWKISFNARAFMARYPYFDKRYDNLWQEFGRAALYQRSSLWSLISDPTIPEEFQARAVMVKNLPPNFCPIPWGKPEAKSQEDNISPPQESQVRQSIQELTFDLRCSFMESISKSPHFDSESQNPNLTRIWQMNLVLLKYLNPTLKDSRSPWLNPLRQRAYNCFRLQGQDPGYPSGRVPFAAFRQLMCSTYMHEVDDMWKKRAEQTVRQMIREELAGDTSCLGALDAYVGCIRTRSEWNIEENPEPLNREIESDMMEFLLGLDIPWERKVPYDVLRAFTVVFRDLGRREQLARLARHFLIEVQPDVNIHAVLHLADQVVRKHLDDPQLLAAANPLASLFRRNKERTPAKVKEDEERDRQAAKYNRILSQMRKMGAERKEE